MERSNAEQLDPSVLGEQVGDTGRAADDFPPDQPMGVEDPALIEGGIVARDDVAMRATRTQIEPSGDATSTAITGLVATGADPDVLDTEAAAVAEVSPTRERGAEASAIHLIDD